MPSRVRIRLTTNGNKFYDMKALSALNNMYRRSLSGGFSLSVVAMPKVRWRIAIALFQNLKPYAHHYDPTMRLLITRERRGQRLRRPVQNVVPKKKVEMPLIGHAPRYQRVALPPPEPMPPQARWQQYVRTEAPVFNPGTVVATTGTPAQEPQVFRWAFNDNDLNR